MKQWLRQQYLRSRCTGGSIRDQFDWWLAGIGLGIGLTFAVIALHNFVKIYF